MEQIKLYTHDGLAHADDAFAVATLKMVYPDAQLERTRDMKTIQTVAGTPGVFLLDIGGVYEPQSRQFDHHQPAGAGFRDPENRWPYATAGLVWKHYGKEAVQSLFPTIDSYSRGETVNFIDVAILRYVDAVDCGIRLKTSGPSISSIVSSFNTPWFEPKSDQFPLIVSLCQQILVNYIKRFVGRVLARDQVRMSRLELGGQLLVLENRMSWNEVVSEEMPEVKLVAYPAGPRGDSPSSWQLHTTMDTDSRPRLLFPVSWAGKEFRVLAEASGEQGAIFCHRSRHLVGVNSYEGMLKLAGIALKAEDEFSEETITSEDSHQADLPGMSSAQI